MVERNEASLPAKEEIVSVKSLRSFIYAAFLGSILGLAAWQASDHNQVHAQGPVREPAVTRTFEEPPCGNFGDVNRSERVTPRDAVLILQNEARLLKFPLDQKALYWGDVTDDGETNHFDALSILHYAAGNIDTFPACDNYAPTRTPNAYIYYRNYDNSYLSRNENARLFEHEQGKKIL